MNELEMVSHVFGIMKQYVSEDDINNSADEIVAHLRDAGYSADDISEYAGKDHPELESALDAYGEYESDRDEEDMNSSDMEDESYDD
jgi:hypothetical protein